MIQHLLGPRRFLPFLFIVAAAVVLLTSLWVKEVDQYAKQSDLLIQMKELDARLDRDVLRVISFLLVQYDPLVETTKRLRKLEEKAKDPKLSFYESKGKRMDDAIDTYWASVAEKLQLQERIKSQAAFVRNGIHYLPVAVQDLKEIDDNVYEEVMVLLNQLYRYNLSSSKTELSRITEQIDVLKLLNDLPSTHQNTLNNIIFHMQANLKGLAQLNQLEARYLSVPSHQQFETLHNIHENYQAEDTRQSRQISMVLSVIILFLLMGLWQLLRKLDTARQVAEQSWNRLHDAVGSLSEAFALFDSDEQLVLHNNKFEKFYPWLGDRLQKGVSLKELLSRNPIAFERSTLDGVKIENEMPLELYLERPDSHRWYLASNNRTTEGGLVCVRTDITESKKAELELRKLSRALEQSPASVVITDTDGIIEYVNPKFEQISGYTASEAIGQNPRIMKSGDKSPEEYKEMWDTITAGKEWRGNFHNKRKDGSIYWESASISPLRNEQGEATHFIAVKEDVTAQKRAEDLLRMNATVFDTTTEGIMVTDADNRIKTVNPAFSRITGYEASEVVGRDPSILSSGRQEKLFYQEMWETVAHQGHWSGEIWNRRKDGSVYPQWLSIASIKDEKSRVSEYVAIFSDITQRKENEEQIRYQANYDALTGLPNRSLLQDRLSQAIMSAGREGWGLALLFIDLDKFKVVNDSFGHVIGDELLQMVAVRIKACVREVDTVARFGGDEFVVLLQDISEPEDAAKVASKIIGTVSEVFDLSSREIFVGASIGITLYPEDADTPDTLLQNADMAMYLAKDTGRNRFQFFTAKIQEQVRVRQSLEHDLRQALKRDEFELYYQPVVDADNESIISVEALLRWHHPQLGFVAPDTFIPLAEEIGLIGKIGMWILHTGCRQVHEWHQAGLGDIEIAFNLSGRQRELGLTANDISLILRETGLSGEFLTLEITESELIEDTAEEITWLQSFKNVGAKLSIDDFGTGYSSLSYLKRFPVDILKIDRAFVVDLPDHQDDASLVEAIVAIAKSLNLKLVAEGVETRAQAEFLKKIGCDYLQGYYFGKPMPATELAKKISGVTGPAP